MSLGECCPPSTSWQVPSVGGRKISDGAKFEIMDRSIGGRPHVESLKSQIEEQIEGVPDVLSLLSANKLNLSGVFKVAKRIHAAGGWGEVGNVGMEGAETTGQGGVGEELTSREHRKERLG